MNAEQVKELLESLETAGTLFLILTGGEPLLRSDLWEILEEAKLRGFAVMLFTSGTGINREKGARLAEFSLFSVHISVYSSDPERHDLITGVPGSFEKTSLGIDNLLLNGISPVIKTPLMDENYNDLDKLRRWARKRNLTHKIDPVISPCYRKNKDRIISRRISREKVCETVFESGIFDTGDFRPREKLECGAGVNMAAVDSCGNVFPCLSWRVPCGRAAEEGFERIWEVMKPDYSHLENCFSCGVLSYCGICPGIASAEGPDFFCGAASDTADRLRVPVNTVSSQGIEIKEDLG